MIADLDSIVSDKNNQFNDCVEDIKVEQNNLDKMHKIENTISFEQIKGKEFIIFSNRNNRINKLHLL